VSNARHKASGSIADRGLRPQDSCVRLGRGSLPDYSKTVELEGWLSTLPREEAIEGTGVRIEAVHQLRQHSSASRAPKTPPVGAA
jgi:hypothetical protein